MYSVRWTYCLLNSHYWCNVYLRNYVSNYSFATLFSKASSIRQLSKFNNSLLYSSYMVGAAQLVGRKSSCISDATLEPKVVIFVNRRISRETGEGCPVSHFDKLHYKYTYQLRCFGQVCNALEKSTSLKLSSLPQCVLARTWHWAQIEEYWWEIN